MALSKELFTRLRTIRLAVLASGKGSLLLVMIDYGLPIALVVVDRECPAKQIAEAAGIPTVLLQRTESGRRKKFDREGYTNQVTHLLTKYQIDLVAMAGWMTFFSPPIFHRFGGRILNTHPSLLPFFKGDTAVADALKAGAKVTGYTIHVATEELDEGLTLVQEQVHVKSCDTIDSLWERIKEKERKGYPLLLVHLMLGMLMEREMLPRPY